MSELSPFEVFMQDKYTKAKVKFQWGIVSGWNTEILYQTWVKVHTQLVRGDYNEQLDPALTRNLIAYLLRDEENFKGDLNKGILLIGSNGTGKSVFIETFLILFHYLHNIKTPSYTGKQIEEIMKMPDTEKEYADFHAALLSPTFFFDDMGEELNYVVVYGTTVEIGKDVLGKRHREFLSKGSLTFATTNILPDDWIGKYGKRINSRIPEMFNVFARSGKDMRDKKVKA